MGSLTESAIRAVYECWNDGDKEGVLSAFRKMGPAGFTVEYVGEEPLDGEAAVLDMWANYAGTCTTDVVEVIVNGNEAAALVANNIHSEDGTSSLPSIETYRVDDGTLFVRYFHRTPEGTYAKA